MSGGCAVINIRNSTNIKLSRKDLIATIVFFCVASVLILSALYSQVIDDEAFYFTIPQRLLQGDRLLVDEWHPTQLAAMFQLLPYYIIRSLAHGTDGIVLSMRLLYVFIVLGLYWYFYGKLRKYGVWGSIATAMFCLDAFLCIYSINYYNLFSVFLAVLGMMLFMSEKEPSRVKLITAGVILSCAVLCSPAFSVFYFLYSAAVFVLWLCKRRGKALSENRFFLLNGFVWKYLTAGVVLSACAFLLYLLINSDVKSALLDSFILRNNKAHTVTVFGNSLNFLKLQLYIKQNWHVLSFHTAMVIAALVYHFRCRRGDVSRTFKSVKAVLLSVLLAVSTFDMAFGFARLFLEGDTDRLFFDPGFFSFFGFAVYFLRDGDDPGILRLMWLSLVCSFSMDYLSNVTVLFGGRLAYLPAFCSLGAALRELRQKPDLQQSAAGGDENRLRRIAPGAASVFSAIFVATLFMYLLFGSNITLIGSLADRAAMVKINRGPYAGIIRSRDYTDDYYTVLDDLEFVTRAGDGPVYISALMPFGYLYLDREIGICTTYYEESDEMSRVSEYWKLFPEKRPSIIYIPKYSLDIDGFADRKASAKLDLFEIGKLCIFTKQETENGIILNNIHWKAFPDDIE